MGKKIEPLSEGKNQIIAPLLKEYYIQSAEVIQDALKDLLGGTIQSMLESEMMSIWCTNRMNAATAAAPETVKIPKLSAVSRGNSILPFRKTGKAV